MLAGLQPQREDERKALQPCGEDQLDEDAGAERRSPEQIHRQQRGNAACS